MIRAYDELYLECARTELAIFIDYGVNFIGIDIEKLFDSFIISGYAGLFENGDTHTLAGMSGIELFHAVFGSKYPADREYYAFSRTPEYWLGWALAYYQWKRNLSFRNIFAGTDVHALLRLYSPYHEMDIEHFCNAVDELRRPFCTASQLSRLRKYAELTQRELSDMSGVSIRTIQQYEQRQKSINNAAFSTIINLSKVLRCRPEELLEEEQ